MNTLYCYGNNIHLVSLQIVGHISRLKYQSKYGSCVPHTHTHTHTHTLTITITEVDNKIASSSMNLGLRDLKVYIMGHFKPKV